MDKYDEYLSFDLPEDYCLRTTKDDEGNDVWKIHSGLGTNDEGDETFENTAFIKTVSLENSPFNNIDAAPGFSLSGNVETRIHTENKEMQVLIFTVNILLVFMWVKKDDHVYAIIGNKRLTSDDDEGLESFVEFLNTALNSAVIDGTKVDVDAITPDLLAGNGNSGSEEEIDFSSYGMPVATPNDNQHTHLDFISGTKSKMSLFGAMVNQDGTEYAFKSLEEMSNDAYDNEDLSDLLNEIVEESTQDFDLSETACNMAELFRVDADCFDASHDREQEIKNGYIQRVETYNLLRSFAWTLSAYCEQEKIVPAALTYESIEEIVDFIVARKNKNYVADSHSPILCSGDDLHVYYIPDSISKEKRNLLLSYDNDEDGNSVSGIMSLDGLRKELEYMYPAIRAIYDQLSANRDTSEPLVNGTADLLYAWCSMAYAARNAIFTEDGPVNCWWEHPDQQEDWELRWKIESIEHSIEYEKEWLKNHSKDLSKNATITFAGKTFVFTGIEHDDEWLEVLEKLTQKGGIHRTGVSGKTNYLVCNPRYAGDSQVRHALEQRIKGKDVKIVLYTDVLKALGISYKTPQEEIAELKAGKDKTNEQKVIKDVVRPEPFVKAVEPIKPITFDEGLKAEGDGYTMAIPDGFKILVNEEGRDFIAYRPNEDDPDDYNESDYIIYAGTQQKNELFDQFATTEEYIAIVNTMQRQMPNIFSNTSTLEYNRESMPGGIFFGFELGCLHGNAYVGIDNYIQTMRVQIDGVTKQNKKQYELQVKDLFDRMIPDKSVQLISHLDDNKYVEMSPSDDALISDWVDNVEEYIKHISLARTLVLNSIIEDFKSKQQSGDADVPKLKRDVKKALNDITHSAETELRKAEYLITLKRVQYPKANDFDEMIGSLEDLIDFCSQSVGLGDDCTITTDSIFADSVKERLEMPVVDSVGSIVTDCDDDSPAYKKLCELQGEAIAAAKREAEEKKRIEEERRRKEAEEAERKKRLAEEEAERKRIEAERLEAERKAAEEAEKKRIAELQVKYDSDYSSWKEACKAVDSERAQFVENSIAEETKRLESAIIRDRDDIIESNNSRISTQTNVKTQSETDLQNAGFFKFGLKKELKKRIEDADAIIAEAKANIKKAESDCNNKLSSVSSDVSKTKNIFIKNAEASLPYPVEPEMPIELKKIAEEKARKAAEEEARKKEELERKRKEEEERRFANMTETQRQNEKIKKQIIDILSCGVKLTVPDVVESLDTEYSNQKISVLCNALVESGEIQTVVDKRRRYFYID